MFYKIPEKLSIDTTFYLAGTIIDTSLNRGIQAKLEIIDNSINQVIATHLSDTNGIYKINLSERKKYGVEITAKGYLFFAETLEVNEMEMTNDTIYKDFTLDKVEIGKKVVLENIYFETGRATLKTTSFPELERVVKLMKDNPGIKLEISGHTDNIGSYLANKRLSEDRAKSVVDYLVKQGVDSSKLTYQGYSFTQPIAPNDTPEGRQQNRRVEFKVLEK
jgi:outer membrane protein OmpA-like peptidoglycan-associated protein